MKNDVIIVDPLGKIKLYRGKDFISEEFEIKDGLDEYIITNDMDPSCMNPSNDVFSTPHSNSYVDLNGDCMPDIFVQKQKKISGAFERYVNYYEIYVQKLFNNKQMYCLQQTNSILT